MLLHGSRDRSTVWLALEQTRGAHDLPPPVLPEASAEAAPEDELGPASL